MLLFAAGALLHATPAGSGPMDEIVIASFRGPLRLDAAQPVVVALPTARPPSSALAATDAATRFALRLDGLSARAQPGVTYRVYFGLQRVAALDPARFAGTINFFGAVALGAATPIDVSLDVTAIARGLAAAARVDDVLAVTIVPDGPPLADSDAAIRGIRLSRR